MNRFRLTLQLHVTGRCNLRCKHCYITERNEDALSLQHIRALIDDFCGLVVRYNRRKGLNTFGQINLTGGEPFIREDFFDILAHIQSKGSLLRFAVLTNGTYITPETAARLKELEPLFVQVSVDGDRETHDALRAPGNFDRTMLACDTLHAAGIRTVVSFTANRMNAGGYPAVLRACRRHRVDKLWTDRLVPIGSGSEIAPLAMDAPAYRRFVQAVRRQRRNPLARLFGTEAALTRSLQFMNGAGHACGTAYQCSAGDSLIAVDEHGDVYPCRRLPIRVGNILDKRLSEIYFGSEALEALRHRTLPEACAGCRHREQCFGGSRCIAWAVTGDMNARDPGCWLALEKHGRRRRKHAAED